MDWPPLVANLLKGLLKVSLVYMSHHYFGGGILNRTYSTYKNLYILLFLLSIFGPIYCSPPVILYTLYTYCTTPVCRWVTSHQSSHTLLYDKYMYVAHSPGCFCLHASHIILFFLVKHDRFTGGFLECLDHIICFSFHADSVVNFVFVKVLGVR